MSANSNPIFHCQSGKILLLPAAERNILCSYSGLLDTSNFLLHGLSQDLITVCPASKQSILRSIHFYETVQFRFRLVGAAPYVMLIQPEQHFTSSGIAGWVPVELYIVVRRIVDHNNWLRLQIWNELLLQPFL
jgi:hypothetical protein